VLRADGTRHADRARVGDAQQTRHGGATRGRAHTHRASCPSTHGSVKAPASPCSKAAARPRGAQQTWSSRPVAATDGVNVSSAEKWGLHRSKARADAAPFTASKKQRLSAIDTCTGYCTQQVVPACSTRCKMRPRLEIGATGRDRSTAAQRWLLGRTDVIIALACCYW
jgi:hypothetical protein